MSSQEYKDILLSLVNRTVLCCILILCHHLGIIVIMHKLVERETRDNKYHLLIFLDSGACIICVWCLCLLSLCPWDSVLCAVIFYQLVLWGRLARLSLACHKINQPLILKIQNYQKCWTWISFKYIEFSLLISIVFDQTVSVGSGELEGIVLDKHRETSGEPCTALE